MGVVNGDFTNGLIGWTTSSLSCGSWLQSVAPEPPFVHIKAQSCNIWIQQDFIIDNPILTFDWSYLEQYGSYGGCDAYAYWSLARISDSIILKSGNLTGSECGASSGTVTEDVSAYIGTNTRIRFTLYPSGQWYAYQSELLIGNVCVSPNLGTLDISSTPAGASVYVDGTDTGFITPKVITDVTPVNHTILLKKAGYYDSYTTVTTKPCRTNIINPALTLIVGLINGTFNTDLTGWNYNPSGYWPYCGATTIYATWESGRAKIWAGYCNASGGAYLNQTFNIAYSTLKFDYQTSTPSPWRYASSWSLVIHDPILPDVTAYNESLPLNGTGTIQKDVSQYIGKSATMSFNTGGLLPGVCYGAYCGGSDWQGQYIWIDNVNIFESTCPTTPKYEGNTVTLQATPRNGIGPYTIEFRKNGITIDSSRLGGQYNPITNAPEDIYVTRVYTLDNEDIRVASTGTIDFSVYITDSCPTGAKSCIGVCTINIGCIAPVCNFTVT